MSEIHTEVTGEKVDTSELEEDTMTSEERERTPESCQYAMTVMGQELIYFEFKTKSDASECHLQYN